MLNYTVVAVKAINEKVNELLIKYDDSKKNTAIDPSVDIMGIARACGIKETAYVPPSELYGKHAIYQDGIVKIDETDTAGQRLFDLAHEVGHIVFNQIAHPRTAGDSALPLFTTDIKYEAARQGVRKKSELPPGERGIEDFFDLFAANLLVPVNRFQLWEDKTDREIAAAFKVEEKCIKKRRKEVEYEIRVLTETMKPCPIEDIVDPDVELDVDTLLKAVNNQ